MAGINYAEERAYWYLRLNGFFVLTDYVVHKSPLQNVGTHHIQYRRDVDIIAIRHPYVWEEIGGQADDFDTRLLNLCEIEQTFSELAKPVIVIGEVKSGDFDPNKVNLSMQDTQTKNTIAVALKRVGIFPHNEISEEMIAQFSQSPFINNEHFLAVKILFSLDPTRPATHYFNINLDETRKFILHRILKYSNEKGASRLFFDSVLFQDNIDFINSMLRQGIGKERIKQIIDTME